MDERLAIAGSGAIACGLAAAAARQSQVDLWARSEESAERARQKVEKICGRLSGEANARNVVVHTDIAELSGATFVVEAIVEDTAAKCELLGELGAVTGPDAIIGSTTSSLSVAELAQASGRPERFVGLHVFNPVPKMKLVELAYPEQASDETRRRATALCAELGKEAVEVPDVPGFVVNRLLFPYLFSAVRFMEETGMAAADVDTCMKLGAGHPMGPLELLDFVGLDVAVAIGDAIGADVPQRLRDLVAEGSLGTKSGAGVATA